MRVRDVMTAKVIGVAESASLLDALETMTKANVSALVVYDNAGTPRGVLSEGDLLRRSELGTQKRRLGWLEFLLGGGRVSEDYAHVHGRRVGELMTKDIIGVAEDDELADAVDLMLAKKIKRLVVLKEGKAVGVLSRADVLKALLRALPAPSASRPDAEVADEIRRAIDAQHWAPSGSIRVEVLDGIVTLSGAIADDRLRDGLRVLAENVPGVKKVRDRLAWIEPNSGFLVPVSGDPDD